MNALDYAHQRTRPDEPASNLAVAAPVTVCVGMVLLVAAIVLCRWPVNHWALDTRWLLAVPIGCAVWSMLAVMAGGMTTRQFSIALGAAIICALLIDRADRLNVLVEYDRWTARGMPNAWGQWYQRVAPADAPESAQATCTHERPVVHDAR